MDRYEAAALLQEQANQRYPIPPRLAALLDAEYPAARDAADALARIGALTEAEPELRAVFQQRGAMVHIVTHLLQRGAEYDPVTERWRIPLPSR
jgi:hypothetical protein